MNVISFEFKHNNRCQCAVRVQATIPIYFKVTVLITHGSTYPFLQTVDNVSLSDRSRSHTPCLLAHFGIWFLDQISKSMHDDPLDVAA